MADKLSGGQGAIFLLRMCVQYGRVQGDMKVFGAIVLESRQGRLPVWNATFHARLALLQLPGPHSTEADLKQPECETRCLTQS